jgi:putative acetyltransferase
MFEIREDDLSGAQTQALLALHLAGMNENSPPGHVFALGLSGLRAPGVKVWTVWDGAEIKSMRTHPAHLRRGVAAALLGHIITHARQSGIRRLSLETGTGPAFDPALTLYRNRGFSPGPAFGDYVKSDFNQFFHLAL